jgi:hypothetical protein
MLLDRNYSREMDASSLQPTSTQQVQGAACYGESLADLPISTSTNRDSSL